jgi:hypothetical protein
MNTIYLALFSILHKVCLINMWNFYVMIMTIHFDEQPIIKMLLCIIYKEKIDWISILPNSIDITLFNENEYIAITKWSN